MVISKPRKFFPQGKESVHGRSPFLSIKNADFPQTIGTKVSSLKEKKSKPIVSLGKKKEKLSSTRFTAKEEAFSFRKIVELGKVFCE